MEITKVEIYKGGELVATCRDLVRAVNVTIEGFPPIEAFSLPLVELERRKVFEHLNGRPLSSFFNEAGLKIDEVDVGDKERAATDTNWSREIEPVFYVHGRSETMRGETTVSAVVLIRFECKPESVPKARDVAAQLPKIYKEVSKSL